MKAAVIILLLCPFLLAQMSSIQVACGESENKQVCESGFEFSVSHNGKRYSECTFTKCPFQTKTLSLGLCHKDFLSNTCSTGLCFVSKDVDNCISTNRDQCGGIKATAKCEKGVANINVEATVPLSYQLDVGEDCPFQSEAKLSLQSCSGDSLGRNCDCCTNIKAEKIAEESSGGFCLNEKSPLFGLFLQMYVCEDVVIPNAVALTGPLLIEDPQIVQHLAKLREELVPVKAEQECDPQEQVNTIVSNLQFTKGILDKLALVLPAPELPTHSEFCQDGKKLAQNPDYTPSQNGCGTDSDQIKFFSQTVPPSYSFTECCNAHDICFGTCATDGNFKGAIDNCNAELKNCMRNQCSGLSFIKKVMCIGYADQSVESVRQFGNIFYMKDVNQKCSCVPQ